MSQDILVVQVGSRLHGLASPTSDVDWRGVFINSLDELVNPFERPEEKRFIEGEGKDDTSSELRKFIKEVVMGNPNSIEVLFSNMVDHRRTSTTGLLMQGHRSKFIDEAEVFKAYKNYSANQLNKMSLFDPDERTPKFAVAYIRSLFNGVELLRDGTITNPIPDQFEMSDGHVFNPREILRIIKFTPHTQFDSVRSMAMDMFARLQIELARVFYNKKRPIPADRAFIRQFVRDAYGVS